MEPWLKIIALGSAESRGGGGRGGRGRGRGRGGRGRGGSKKYVTREHDNYPHGK